MALVGFEDILFQIPKKDGEIFTPGLVWSNQNGKVYDVKEETC